MAHILLEEAANFHFGLKLWLVVNDEKINCLRWNAEKTAVIIDLSSLGEVYTSKMFSMQTVEDFLRQLKYNGFERCSPGANESLDSTCVVYRHSAFVLSNEELFREWLLFSLHTGGFIDGFHPRITSDINLLDEQINIRGSETAKEPDAFLDENLNTDTEHSTSLAVDSFLVDKNSVLGQNLAGITCAIAEFSNIYGSLDSGLYATNIKLEPVDTISVDSVFLCMDEETPSI